MVAPARATSRQGKWHTFLRAPYHILTTTKGRNICGKAPLLPGQNRLWLPPPCPPETDECPNHPDLYLLRDAAADERGAIADYLACAAETCLDEIFRMLPKMRWSTMRKRCGLFPGLIRSVPKCSQKKLRRAGNETADRQAEMGYRQKPRKRRMSWSPRAKKICPPFNASPRPYKMNCMP